MIYLYQFKNIFKYIYFFNYLLKRHFTCQVNNIIDNLFIFYHDKFQINKIKKFKN